MPERSRLAAHLEQAWGSTAIVSRGLVHDAAALPALLAFAGGELAGVATFHHAAGETELVTLDALHRGAVDAARALKPSIPELGEHGIPIRDELEFELLLPHPSQPASA